MENIIDMIAMDSEPAKISDELKDLMYQKAAKRVEDLRPEIGNVSLENAQLAAEQLLISLKIDNESGVRSNCIWSLCRLYEKLNNTFQESFVDECTKIALFDKEPSVMEEAKTALDSMGMQGFYN